MKCILIFILSMQSNDSLFVIPSLQSPLQIDGKIDEKVWNKALKVSGFKQYYPEWGEDASNQTIVLLLHDKDNLYVGVKCWMPGGKVIARETRRDRNVSLGADETFGIELDANNNDRDCFLFAFTPLEIQTDGKVYRKGRKQSLEWDGLWKSQVSRTNFGWEAEVEIPFDQINIEGKVMGINFYRVSHGDNGTPQAYFWKLSPSKGNFFDISSFPSVKLSSNYRKKSIQFSVLPYITANSYNYSNGNPSDEWNIGGSAEILTQFGLEGAMVFNPDFATVEADVDQIDLSKTGIYLTEKRPFFKNELSHFKTPIELFYTRSFEEVEYGGRIKWERGSNSFITYIVNSDGKNHLISRAKGCIFKGSYIGGEVIGIKGEDSLRKVASLDWDSELPYEFCFRSQLVRDFGEKKNLYKVVFERNAPFGFQTFISHEYIPPDYFLETAWIPITDLVSDYVDLGYTWQTGNKVMPMVGVGGDFTYWQNTDGILRRKKYQGSLGVAFQGNFDVSAGYEGDHHLYQGSYYDNNLLFINISRRFSNNEIGFFYYGGSYYGGKLDFIKGDLEMGIARKLTLSLIGKYYRFKVGDNVSTTLISVLKANYRILPKLTFRTFLQWSDQSEELQTNFLLAYEFFAGSHIYLVWNETRETGGFEMDDWELPQKERRIFLKACYQFNF